MNPQDSPLFRIYVERLENAVKRRDKAESDIKQAIAVIRRIDKDFDEYPYAYLPPKPVIRESGKNIPKCFNQA